jgi:hypothetical protein
MNQKIIHFNAENIIHSTSKSDSWMCVAEDEEKEEN